MLEALCRSSGTTLDIRMSRDGPPITQRTSGLVRGPHDSHPLCAGARTRVEYVREDTIARRLQVPCRRFLRKRGILFCLYLTRVSMPILGTGFTETPEASGVRSIVNAIFFVTFFYLGFIRESHHARRLAAGDTSPRGGLISRGFDTHLALLNRRAAPLPL